MSTAPSYASDNPPPPPKVEPPLTQPPLEPEEKPIVVHDMRGPSKKDGDETAGDEGIDDDEGDDTQNK